jgi:nucleotide-binding universal stress UspA family protein
MRVLIATDGSDCSNFALASVTERSWPEDAEFRIVTVVEPAYLQPPLGGAFVEPMLNLQVEFENSCHELIREKTALLKETFPNHAVSGETLLGPVATVILEEALSWKADLIIIGSHGRTGVKRFLLGSIADKVASHSPCSIEIVKQKTHAANSATKMEEVAAVGGKA